MIIKNDNDLMVACKLGLITALMDDDKVIASFISPSIFFDNDYLRKLFDVVNKYFQRENYELVRSQCGAAKNTE